VRGEHSSEGKSDLSTRRSVPMADVLAIELVCWSQRTIYNADNDLVFGHPQTGRPLDRTKVSRRFKWDSQQSQEAFVASRLGPASLGALS
jgi:hypothetical protein